MKFTFNWLKEYLETDASINEISDKLTAIGLEVEAIEDKAAALAPFTVAHVLSAEKHPDADRLKVCIVDTGSEQVQVVCGAPNAHTGMMGVFAPVGSYIPGTDMTLKPGKIRGQQSNGMLVSEREMGISDEHEGIIELPEDATVGQPFASLMGLDDPMIEIAITPNRQDALGVYGVARDLAASGIGTLKPYEAAKIEGSFDSPIAWKRDLPDDKQDACPLVVGRYFRGLKNGPSPEWLQQRLRAIGLRPISALVDITNFVTYDLGRPLHVFDADKLAGDLTMRMARDGEEIQALDGRSYTLDSEMVVIADADAVHGIGGVMGGETTGCQGNTTNVFLEVALFDPIRVATTGRKLSINSDARYRFERGVDPESAWWGAEVATRLVQEFCGGEASHIAHAGDMPDWTREVAYRPGRVESLGAVAVPEEEQKRILTALGFDLKDDSGDTWTLQSPAWRRDVSGEADLVEDVLRIHGFDQVPVVPMRSPTPLPRNILTPLQRRTRLAQRALAARGLLEAVTWSFMRQDQAALFGGGADEMQLANPISVELDAMRPSILPNLIAAAGRNADKGLGDSALFEVGPQYSGLGADDQALVAAGIRNGDAGARHWEGKPRPVDAFDAKADALAALEAAGAPVASLQVSDAAPEWYHPGRAGAFKLGNKVLGTFGEIHPGVLRRLDVAGPVVGFEVMLDALPPQKSKASKTWPLLRPSAFQPVERDFAFIVDADVPADKLVRAAWGADKALVSGVTLFDVYEGENIGADKKSIALSVTLQPTDATLTDAEIDAVAQKVVANVAKQTGGELRR